MMQQPRARSEQLVIQELAGELLVYDLDRHKASCLNTTAAGVWKKCDGARTITQIATELTNEWATSVSEDLVWLTLEKLGKARLLKERIERPVSAASRHIPRREMMRRMQVASVVAAPLIASILAPTALASVSSRPSGSTCTDGQQCASKVCMAGPGGTGTCM